MCAHALFCIMQNMEGSWDRSFLMLKTSVTFYVVGWTRSLLGQARVSEDNVHEKEKGGGDTEGLISELPGCLFLHGWVGVRLHCAEIWCQFLGIWRTTFVRSLKEAFFLCPTCLLKRNWAKMNVLPLQMDFCVITQMLLLPPAVAV